MLDTTSELASSGIPQVEVRYGGFPRLVSLMDDMVAGNPNTLKLHAGDAITGTLWYSLFKGEADAAAMGFACFDAFALGNHEFDDGDSALADFLKMLGDRTKDCPNGPTKVLAANVVPGMTSRLKTENLLLKSHVFTVGGERVGVVGIDIAKKTMESSSPSPGTVLTDEVQAAQAEIDALRADGVDKIIVLSHVGFKNDQSFAKQLSGVDVMVGGDSHSLLGDAAKIAVAPGGTPLAAYPTVVNNKDGDKVCVVQAWHYSRAVGVLSVNFNANGVVTSCGGGPKFPIGSGSTMQTRPANRNDPKLPLNSADQTRVLNKLAMTDAVVKPEHANTKAWIDTNKGQIATMQV